MLCGDESLIRARSFLEKYHSVNSCTGLVRPGIRNSWQRCLRQGLQPNSKPREARLSEPELHCKLAQNERFLYFARPELKKLRSQISYEFPIINLASSQ